MCPQPIYFLEVKYEGKYVCVHNEPTMFLAEKNNLNNIQAALFLDISCINKLLTQKKFNSLHIFFLDTFFFLHEDCQDKALPRLRWPF